MEILNQIYQKTLVKQGLPGFWGRKFQPGLPGKPGNTRLTKHFWLGFLSRDLSYQTFMVNYNQAYLESLVKPGSTRLSILVDNCQKPGKSGSTRVYQAHQAFNQTFGAILSALRISYLISRVILISISLTHNPTNLLMSSSIFWYLIVFILWFLSQLAQRLQLQLWLIIFSQTILNTVWTVAFSTLIYLIISHFSKSPI